METFLRRCLRMVSEVEPLAFAPKIQKKKPEKTNRVLERMNTAFLAGIDALNGDRADAVAAPGRLEQDFGFNLKPGRVKLYSL